MYSKELGMCSIEFKCIVKKWECVVKNSNV